MQLTDKRLFDDVRHFELVMLASRGEVRQLSTQIDKGVEFGQARHQQKLFYSALIAEASGDTTTAGKNFDLLGRSNPFFEEAIIGAAAYFRKKDPKSIKPYFILTEAIYVNKRSVKLLRAYAEEALRQGFDDYALSAVQTLNEILKELD